MTSPDPAAVDAAPGSDPRSDPGPDGVPTLTLPVADETAELLRVVQGFVLAHPAAAKALFDALVAEGEAVLATPEGRAEADRLARSELLAKARILLDLPGLAMLERRGSGPLPSTYLDTVMLFASEEGAAAVLDRLFARRAGDDAA